MGAIWTSDNMLVPSDRGHMGPPSAERRLRQQWPWPILETIESEGVLENVKRQEERIRDAVSKWNFPVVKELRGVGLMLGFVLDAVVMETAERGYSGSGKTPALFLVNAAREAGLFTVPAGEQTVRWLPPLNVTDAEVDEALDLFESVLSKLCR